MIDTINEIKNSVEAKAALKTLSIFIVVTIVLVSLTGWFLRLLLPEFISGIAVGFSKVTMFFAMSWLWSRFAIPEIKTSQEVNKGNIAVAIFEGAFIIGLAIVCASI